MTENAPMTDTTNDKPPKEKRDEFLPPVRVTKSELAAIQTQAKAAGLSLSDYRRGIYQNGRVVVRDNAADVEATRQLLALGRNLNQLTKSAHINGIADVKNLIGVLDKIEAAVDRLLP